MNASGYQHYKEQSVNTMTSGELLLLLYDEMIKRLMRAELALKKSDYDLFEQSVKRTIEIVRYLQETLDPQYAISRELNQMYQFFLYELSRIQASRSPEVIAELRPLVEELRDAFREASKQVT